MKNVQNELLLKIQKVNIDVADLGKMFTHLKHVGFTQGMSQIIAKTRKGIYREGWVQGKSFPILTGIRKQSL